MGDWTLFSNHGHVLLYLAGNTEARLRDVAEKVGITERAVQKIVRELQDGGFLSVTKHGRCNRYRINARKALRHPVESHCTISKLIQLVNRQAPAAAEAAAAEKRAAAEPAEPAPPKPAGPRPAAQPAEPPPAQPAARSRTSRKPADDSEAVDSRQQRSLF